MSEAEPRPAARERCRHGLITMTCATCTPPRMSREPTKRAASSVHSAGALDRERLLESGIAVVRTCKGRRGCGIEDLEPKTLFVHIDGMPYLWALEGILAKCPGLKTVQVIPSMFEKLRSGSALCEARGVEIVAGHIKPELAWEEGRNVAPQYAVQRHFLLHLDGNQRKLFDELLALGFEAAAITSRYFCLAGEDFISQRLIANEHGFSRGHNAIVSAIVLSVLFYLDDTLVVGDGSKRRTAAMREQVARLRPLIASAERRLQLAKDLGVPGFAPTFPLARVDVLGKLIVAVRTGKLDALKLSHPRDHEALVLRFGLDDLQTPIYRTLLEAGEMMGGITRERVRQLEERGLGLLGITEDG